MCSMLGGRAAEEIMFGEISSGALDDLEKVTKQAYNMVAFYGLDKNLGPISYYDSSGQYQGMMGKPYSEEMRKPIDKEVQDLIIRQHNRDKDILVEHKDELKKLAERLMDKEVADIKELEGTLGVRKARRLLETV